MTPKEAFELVRQGKALLVDVREEDELRAGGTAEGALWMPLSGLVEDTDQWRAFKAALPRDKTVILFCKIGGRAGRMGEFLAADGFRTENLGGFADWKGAGLPVAPFKKP
jgi:rhodanese-related sulfurtransferase